MGNEKTSPIGLLLLAVAVLALCGLFASTALATITPDKTTKEIEMVQPQAWPFGLSADTDEQYAEHVNEPNSRANVNNSEAELNMAQAEAIQAQTAEERHKDATAGAIVAYVFLCVVGLLMLGMISMPFVFARTR